MPTRQSTRVPRSGCVTLLVLLMAAAQTRPTAAQPAPAPAEPAAAPAAAPDASPAPDGAAATPALGAGAALDTSAATPDPEKPADAAKPKPAPPKPPEDDADAPPPNKPIESEERLANEEQEPSVDIAARLGSGFMRGGQGGLTSAQREPFTLDIEVLKVKDATWLFGGALRIELEDAKSVAGIARIALRHPMGSFELRPGAGIPFYFAPRTMLGAEGFCAFRMPLSAEGLGLSGSVSAAAFFTGNDIPHGSTVIMFHVFIGVDLLI
jgi:hypothetical protein